MKKIYVASLALFLCGSVLAEEIYTTQGGMERFDIYSEQLDFLRYETPQVPNSESDYLTPTTIDIIEKNGDVRIYYALLIDNPSEGRSKAIYYYSRNEDQTHKVVDLVDFNDSFGMGTQSFCLDSDNGYVFWSDSVTNDYYTLNRANLEGGDKTVLRPDLYQETPRSFVADPVRQKVYWTRSIPREAFPDHPYGVDSRVYTINYDGSAPSVLIPTLDNAEVLAISTNASTLYTWNYGGQFQYFDLDINSLNTISPATASYVGRMRIHGGDLWFSDAGGSLGKVYLTSGISTNFYAASGLDFDFAPNKPTTLLIDPAVELRWISTPGITNQVQYTTNLVSDVWFDLGEPIPGEGSTNQVFDSTREANKRYYRIISE